MSSNFVQFAVLISDDMLNHFSVDGHLGLVDFQALPGPICAEMTAFPTCNTTFGYSLVSYTRFLVHFFWILDNARLWSTMLDNLLDSNFTESDLIKSAKLFKCLTFLD